MPKTSATPSSGADPHAGAHAAQGPHRGHLDPPSRHPARARRRGRRLQRLAARRAQTLQPRKDGKRAVTKELPSEEDALTICRVTERLMKAHPQLDADLVEGSVQTTYEELKYPRVRTYLPLLIERRAKDLPGSDEQTERGTRPAAADRHGSGWGGG
ncbi:three-helix bundle dimerization domain-containing protein [Streptomyces sp. NPDC006514]|uniref:three-helix bundle dimerization domain-containing protein n=1 Tax=Streptomyces sp. NPDC006514 TaxID=3154308 RepID=UPI0033A70608